MGNSKSKQIPPAILNDRSEEIIVSLRNGTPLTPTVTISCAVGDITSFSALNGAVINAANGNLIYGLGIAQALRRAGGPILDTESAALMAEYAKHNMKPLPAGGATVTGPGNMANYKKIIQAIGPVVGGKKPTPEERFRLMQAYEQVFRVAELYGCDKLIIPFLSTGQFGFETKMEMQTALLAVLNKLPAHGISEVVFVCNDKTKIEKFKKIAKGTLPLHLQSRKHATHLLVNHCADIRFDILPSIKTRVAKEINDLFDVTQIVLGITAPVPAPVALNVPQASSIAATAQSLDPSSIPAPMIPPFPAVAPITSTPLSNPTNAGVKRRLPLQTPVPAKKSQFQASLYSKSPRICGKSQPLQSTAESRSQALATTHLASSQASQGFAAEKAAHAARMREARARESQEQTAARNAKKNEKQRITRAAQSQESQEQIRILKRRAEAERVSNKFDEEIARRRETERLRIANARAAR